MKFCRSSRIVLCLSLATAVAVGAYFWIEASGGIGIRNSQVRWVAKKLHLTLAPLTDSERAAARLNAAAWKAKFLA